MCFDILTLTHGSTSTVGPTRVYRMRAPRQSQNILSHNRAVNCHIMTMMKMINIGPYREVKSAVDVQYSMSSSRIAGHQALGAFYMPCSPKELTSFLSSCRSKYQVMMRSDTQHFHHLQNYHLYKKIY